MRDILLVVVVFGSIPFILRSPYIGVLMYVWMSVMNPHRLTWSYSYNFTFAAVVALATLVSTIFSKEWRRPPVGALGIALILFVAWTGVTTAFSLFPANSYERWESMMKTQIMVCLIPIFFHSKERIRQLLWVIVLSIAYYGVKGGAWILLTGGGERVWGPPGSYIEENNALAVAIVMTIPLMRYLQLTTPHKFVRWGLTVMMLLSGVAVLGTYSRGALFAVTAMILFLWWKGREKLPLLFAAIVFMPLALWFMPERWYDRMDTIATYEQDGSARMRLNAWGTMFNIAMDRPIVGGGYEVAAKEVFDKYSPDPSFPPQVAHSIYFQALGEHGFVGLGLFLWLYWMFWRQAGALIRTTGSRHDLAWARDFGSMIQVTLIAFLVGGAFLSLINFDVPYYLVGILLAIKALVDQELRGAVTDPETRGLSGSLTRFNADKSPKPHRS